MPSSTEQETADRVALWLDAARNGSHEALGLLLEQTFSNARIQMVSSLINPAGTGRWNDFSRTDEYLFFAMLGRDEAFGHFPAAPANHVHGLIPPEYRWCRSTAGPLHAQVTDRRGFDSAKG